MRYLDKIKKAIDKKGFSNIAVSLYNGSVKLTGELDKYEDILTCGKLAVSKHSRGVINDIKLKNHTPQPMKQPDFTDEKYHNRKPDVVIVGAGIVGSAIARELSRYNLGIMLLEKEYDVATGQSSRNDGMIHAGIDLSPSCVKVKYNMRGNKLYNTLSKELDIPISKCGQCVLYSRPWVKYLFPFVKFIAHFNDIPVKKLSQKEIEELIPNPGYKYNGLMCSGAGIVSPYMMTVALAENAVVNGAEICLNTAVTSIDNDGKKVVCVHTNRGDIFPKVLINASGIYSDVIAEWAGDRHFTIHPRKGVEAVIDSKAINLTKTVVGKFGPKDKDNKNHSKGGGVIVTIDNNLLIGPNAFEVIDRENNTTDSESLNDVFTKQSKLVPGLKRSDIITYFAGTRAATYEEQFVVEKSPIIENLVQAAGIQSPGITAAPAIAEDISKWAVEILSKLQKVEYNPNFNPIRKSIPNLKEMSETERNELIKKNPDYGIIVCRCEQISRGEIIDAINSPIPAPTIDGIKRRVRAGMGRCQGGFCAPIVTKLIAEQTNKNLLEVTKKGEGSEVGFSYTKGGNL